MTVDARRLRALLELGRHEEVRAAGARALAEAPDDPVLLSLVSLAETLGDEPEAGLATARRAVAAAPEDPDAAWALAHALRGTGRSGDALDELERAAALSPRWVGPRVAYCDAAAVHHPPLARLHPGEARRLLERARFHAQQALAIAPDDPGPHLATAKVALLADDVGAAERSVRAALALQADHPVAHQLLGLVAERRGDRRAASDHYLDAGRLDPTSRRTPDLLRTVRGSPVSGCLPVGLLALGVIVALGAFADDPGVSLGERIAYGAAGAVLVAIAVPIGRWLARRRVSAEANAALDREDRLRRGR